MTGAHPRRAVALLVTGALIGAAPAGAAPSNKRRARVAVSYIASKQRDNGSVPAFSMIGSTADAVLAFTVAKRGPNARASALRFLARRAADPTEAASIDSVGEKAKVVLAAVAGGRDPRDFGGRNLVREIRKTRRDSGRYGKGTPVFDQALALLALDAAVARPSERAARWLADAQCRDGGWQFDEPARAGDNRHCFDGSDQDFFTSDTNTTSYAVQALTVNPAPVDVSPFRFFRRARDDVRRGWGYSPRSLTDANSTALVIQAYAARHRERPRGTLKALRRLQYRLCGRRAGAFAYTYEPDGGGGLRKAGPDIGATIGAVPGVRKRPLPVAPLDVSKPVPDPDPC